MPLPMIGTHLSDEPLILSRRTEVAKITSTQVSVANIKALHGIEDQVAPDLQSVYKGEHGLIVH
jgi:hypothetical protein